MMRAGLANYGHAPSPAETSLLRCIVLGEPMPPMVAGLVTGAQAARIEPGIARLLPALRGHADLGSLPKELQDLIVTRHRESTCRYLALKAGLCALIPPLAAGGIEVLMLKGFPLATLYYDSVGARPMGDLDLAVRPPQYEAARRVLERAGFATAPERSAAAPGPGNHAVGFYSAEGLEIDLHIHVLRPSRWEGADDAFWDRALPLQVREHTVLTLCAADQLLHACIHGLQRKDISPVRWIVDAAAIVQSGLADWPTLAAQVARHDCAGPMLACLGYLRAQFRLPIPVAILDELGRLPYSEVSDRYFQLVAMGRASRAGPRHWLERLAVDRARYARGQAAAGCPAPGLAALAASKLELDGLRALPVVLRRLLGAARRRQRLRRPRAADPR